MYLLSEENMSTKIEILTKEHVIKRANFFIDRGWNVTPHNSPDKGMSGVLCRAPFKEEKQSEPGKYGYSPLKDFPETDSIILQYRLNDNRVENVIKELKNPLL